MTDDTPARKRDNLYGRLVELGLRDPFVQAVAGMVAIAAIANIAVSIIGSGAKAIITLALCLAFGVVIIVLRTITKYVDSTFVKVICFVLAGTITAVFLVFVLFLIPAALICWPPGYADLLGLTSCESKAMSRTDTPVSRPFTPVAYTGSGVAFSEGNRKYRVNVFYRLERQDDAEHIVGALRTAGYQADGVESDLNEVMAPDRRPDTTVIKANSVGRAAVAAVSEVTQLAIPLKAPHIAVAPDDTALKNEDVEIALF